jgi:hypothetical protein
VIINGNNFSNPIAVSFDGVVTTDFLESSNERIVVRIPTNVNGSASRSINVSVQTLADISGNYTFSLLGTPVVTKISPDNNPNNWAFLIEGTNLGSIKKVSIDGKVPDIGIRGIDKQAYNYITTKVPKDVTPATDRKLRLYYTNDDFEPIERAYEVLSVPPPGVFPPPTIILPPPLPSNYVQTDLSDYWIDENFKSSTTDTILSCYQLRGDFGGAIQVGEFCEVNVFYALKQGPTWELTNNRYATDGTWDHGYVSFLLEGNLVKGRVFDKASNKLVMEDHEGRQLILVGDKSGNCKVANVSDGPCN